MSDKLEEGLNSSHTRDAANPSHNATNASSAPHTDSHTPQAESRLSGGSGALFSFYLKRAGEEDEKKARNWSKDADGIIFFTGLFATVVAAFLQTANPYLYPSSQDITAFYIAQLYQITAAGNSTGPFPPLPFTPRDPSRFKPSSSTICVNVLWFLSLIISITCALLAVSLQQWARRYLQVTQTQHILDKRARIRAYFAEGVKNLHLPTMIEILYGLLHLSVFLFFAGLPIFLFSINYTVFSCVLACVGTISALYLSIAFLPLVRNDSPYYMPLTPFLWFCIQVSWWCSLRVWQGIALRGSIKPRTQKKLSNQVKKHYTRLQGGLMKCLEASALTSFEEFDVQVLSWTFDLTDEEDGLDQFLAAIPGFFNSSSVKNTQEALGAVSPERLSNAVLQSVDRFFSSTTVSDSERRQRGNTCMEVIGVRQIPGQLIMEESLRFIGTGVFKWIDLGLLARSVDSVEAQCVTALITAHARGSDGHWFQPMKDQLNVSDATLQTYLGNGDSLLLANLNNFVRWLDGHQVRRPQMKAVDNTLSSLSKFDAKNASLELRDDFCTLWDTTLSAAEEVTSDRAGLALSTLRRIGCVYMSLHPRTGATLPVACGAPGDDADADRREVQSYPRCTHNHAVP